MSMKRFGQSEESYELGWISGFFRRKKRSPQQVKDEDNTSEVSRLMMMRRNKAKNLHLFLSEIMRKLKHAIKKEKRFLGKTKSFHKSLSTKDHSISQEEDDDHEKHLCKMSNDGDFDPNSATSKQIQRNQRKIVYLPEYSARILEKNSTVFSTSASDDFIKSEPLAGSLCTEYEIGPPRGESRIQQPCHIFLDKNHSIDEKEYVFSYVKAVLDDAIGSNWEELYLRTGFSDQLLNPALISNIPFHPNQLCVDHELLFDCINEVLFEYCRFPQFSVESIICKAQETVYSNLLPFQLPWSVDQILREDMSKHRNWLDIRCELECIGFDTSELILNVLLEELILDL